MIYILHISRNVSRLNGNVELQLKCEFWPIQIIRSNANGLETIKCEIEYRIPGLIFW